MGLFLNIWQTILLVSLLILMAWLLDKLFCQKAGYRWRKILWAVLAVWMLLPFPMRLPSAMELTLPLPKGISMAMPKADVEENAAEDERQALSASQTVPDGETAAGRKNAAEGEKGTGTKPADAAAEPVKAAAQTAGTAAGMMPEGFMHKGARDREFAAPLQEQSGADMLRTGWIPMFYVIWAAGALAALGLRAWQYGRMRKKYMAEAIPCQNEDVRFLLEKLCEEQKIRKKIALYYHESFLTPMLFGYFRPVILLPFFPYKKEELEAVLRHEATHYRSKDLWYKLLLVAVCDIYWFWLPLRLMKRMAFQDVEYVCDQKATRNMNLEKKGIYSSIILKTMSGRSNRKLTLTTQFGGNKRMAKKRMENIFRMPRRGLGAAILCVLLLALTTGTACVSVKMEDGEGGQQPVQETAGVDTENAQTADGGPAIAAAAQDAEQVAKTLTVQEALLAGADWEELRDQLAERNPGVTFEAEEYNFDGEQRLMDVDQFLEQGTIMSYTWSSGIVTLGREGRLADLSEALEERGWTQYISAADRELLMDEDGSVYGIPYSGYALGLMCNKRLFEEAGLVDESGRVLTPKTWEELAQYAVQIKERTGQAGLCLLAGDNAAAWHFSNIAWNFGLEEFCTANADGGYTAHLNDPAAVAAMEFVKDLKWKYDVLTPDPESEDYNTGYAHLTQQTAAMYIAGNDSVGMLVGENFEPDDLVLTAIPAGPQGDQHSLSASGAIVISANADEEEIEAALDLVELLLKGPELSEEKKAQIDRRIAEEAAQNIPTIPQFAVWSNEELQSYEEEALTALGNMDISAAKEFFDAVKTPGNLKGEGAFASDLYGEILKVMHQVLNDPEADVEALMNEANENYQRLIDAD